MSSLLISDQSMRLVPQEIHLVCQSHFSMAEKLLQTWWRSGFSLCLVSNSCPALLSSALSVQRSNASAAIIPIWPHLLLARVSGGLPNLQSVLTFNPQRAGRTTSSQTGLFMSTPWWLLCIFHIVIVGLKRRSEEPWNCHRFRPK